MTARSASPKVVSDDDASFEFNKDKKAKTALKAMLRMTKSFAKSPVAGDPEADGAAIVDPGALFTVIAGDEEFSPTPPMSRTRSNATKQAATSSAAVAAAADDDQLLQLQQRALTSTADVEYVEGVARQRKADSFTARILKMRFMASTGYLTAEHFANLTRKRLHLVVDYEPYDRIAIVHNEERARMIFEVYITLARVLDEHRHEADAAIEMLVVAHFNAINAHAREQWNLWEDVFVEREEIEHEMWGWRMWHLVDYAASLHKPAVYVAAVAEADRFVSRFAIETLEFRSRLNVAATEGIRRQLLLSKLMLESQHDSGVHGMLFADKALTQHFRSTLAPLLSLRRAWLGFKARREVFALLVEDWPYRRRLAAASLMHRVAKAFFIRKFFFVYHHHCHRTETAAAKLLQRCGRGFVKGRWWLVQYDLRQRLLRKERLDVAMRAIPDSESAARGSIESEGLQVLASLEQESRRLVVDVATQVLLRVTSAFVTRYDLHLWRRFGRDPVQRCIGRGAVEMAALGRACDWHNMAANHRLWDGDLCDVNIN